MYSSHIIVDERLYG